MSGPNPSTSAPVPTLRFGQTRLRAVRPHDYDYLRTLEQEYPESVFYRHRGVSVAPEAYASTLWSGVLLQYISCTVDSDRPTGILACYSADFRNGHARLAHIVHPDFAKSGKPLAAARLFIDYIFDVFPLRKLYGDVIEFNAKGVEQPFGSVTRIEGRLVDHEWHAGRYWDLLTYAIYREEWLEARNARAQRAARFHQSVASAVR